MPEGKMHRVPPRQQLEFGSYVLDEVYKKELYKEFPDYTVEQIICTYLGHNPFFPSQTAWQNRRQSQSLFRNNVDCEEMTPE